MNFESNPLALPLYEFNQEIFGGIIELLYEYPVQDVPPDFDEFVMRVTTAISERVVTGSVKNLRCDLPIPALSNVVLNISLATDLDGIPDVSYLLFTFFGSNTSFIQALNERLQTYLSYRGGIPIRIPRRI